MTNTENLINQLKKSGWTITDETDEDGYKICRASEEE